MHRRENEGGSTTDDSLEGKVEISSFHSSDETSYRDVIYLAAKLAGVDNPHNTIQSAPAKEGFAILHHQDCWHGSGPNLSSKRHRHALVVHYIRGDVTFRDSSNNNEKKRNGPFGRATYIYGRYKRSTVLSLMKASFQSYSVQKVIGQFGLMIL